MNKTREHKLIYRVDVDVTFSGKFLAYFWRMRNNGIGKARIYNKPTQASMARVLRLIQTGKIKLWNSYEWQRETFEFVPDYIQFCTQCGDVWMFLHEGTVCSLCQYENTQRFIAENMVGMGVLADDEEEYYSGFLD